MKFTYQWKKGATLKYRVVQQSTTTLSGLPGGMGDLTIDQSTTQTLSSVVEDVAADGAATLRQTVEAIKAEINSPMMAMSYDSAANTSTGATIFKEVFSQLIGQPYTVTIAATGEVKKVAGLSQLADKMFKSITPDPATAGMLDGLKANLSDDAMRNMFTQSFAQFPDKPIKAGDTWDMQATSSNPMLGTLITSVKSTLKSIDAEAGGRTARVAVITFRQARRVQARATESDGHDPRRRRSHRRRRADLRRQRGPPALVDSALSDSYDDVGNGP